MASAPSSGSWAPSRQTFAMEETSSPDPAPDVYKVAKKAAEFALVLQVSATDTDLHSIAEAAARAAVHGRSLKDAEKEAALHARPSRPRICICSCRRLLPPNLAAGDRCCLLCPESHAPGCTKRAVRGRSF